MGTRLYAVTAAIGGEKRDHLVDASTKSTAASHVAAKYVKAEIASGKIVAEFMAKGIQPESAVNVAGSGQQGSIE